MLAAAIWIDRAVEGNVRRIVAGDDLARRVRRYRGLERWQILKALPAVVEGNPRQRLIAARRVRQCAAAAAALTVDQTSRLARRRGGERHRRGGSGGAPQQWV